MELFPAGGTVWELKSLFNARELDAELLCGELSGWP